MPDLIVLKNHPNLLGRARKKGDILKNVPPMAAIALCESEVCAHHQGDLPSDAVLEGAAKREEHIKEAKTKAAKTKD